MYQKNTAPKGGVQLDLDLNTQDISGLPSSMEDRIDLIVAGNLSPQQARVLCYVHGHEGPFTHEISRDCGVGNVSTRVRELNRKFLRKYGLLLQGHSEPGHCNRFGAPCSEYRWWISKVL